MTLVERQHMAGMHLTSSATRRGAGAALLLAALSIPIQIAGGVDYPAVPPGLLILAAAAALVLFAPWLWSLALAAAATLFISVGGILAPTFRAQLGDPDRVLAFGGSALQVIGLVIGMIFLVAAIADAVRDRNRATMR